MSNTNIVMLMTVAEGLGKLKDDVVFVGGSVAELYIKDAHLSDIRPTQDVDCVIEISSKLEYYKLEKKLRKKGFKNDTSQGAPLCRWIYKDTIVDVMPDNEDIIGFTNIWYPEGIKNKITKTLPDGTEIYIFRKEYYLASKFEAHKNRGGRDLRQSHDFEDIIYIMDNCPDIVDSISNANKDVKSYLSTEYTNLLNNKNLIEGIESALPYGSGAESTDIIFEMINKIIEITK